ncbi:Cadmium-exporting ATPase [Lentibacillus sp. JNUCC-1]|uniref:heavy metal translocating P-type ATPase n=1 Tax=Lentibacillus sp. JNUCC-1 TaxID=2654513 RepID=UPI0012E83DC3|nr:cation-translocating P-type ATPase [Lentibacillus sp. JNUCC-1]MUV38363.1 Cadmium-exporting ATPase [Lentibacillus sp. JNUCC-1]
MKNVKQVHIVIAAGSLLLLAAISHMAGLDIWKNAALIGATVAAGYTIMIKALQSLRMKAFSIELLVTIAVIGALIIGEYVESAAVTFLFLFGAYLEARTLEKTRSSLKTLMDLAPDEAVVLIDGKRNTVPVEEIEKGDRVLIQSGGKIAIDGTIVSGQAFVNEAAITGESVPINKTTGDQVYSGAIIDNGYLEVTADKIGDETTFAKIIELVEEAQESKAKTQKYLERFAGVYTPGILVLSIIVFLFTRNIEMTLTFLVIACPGALVISAPVSLVAGIGNGARNGALLKGGEVMERLAKVDVVVFDKTGTLTKGKPEVRSVQAFNISEDELLKTAAEVEVISEHHLGRTIVEAARKRGLNPTNKPENFTVEKGHGLHADIAGRHVVVGNRKLIGRHGITIPTEVNAYATQEERQGTTAIFVAIAGRIAGVISIADAIREEAADMISQLKSLGIKKTVMLTGDNKHTAEKVAGQLGIDFVQAEMLPGNKVEHIKRLKKAGHQVAMVGDGINDAPAIALADVGIAMGAAGTDAAMETADVVLMADRLEKIPYAYALSEATVRNMKQNMFFAVGTVGLLLAGVLLGKVFLASGMLIHEASVLLVILNALRLIRFRSEAKRQRNNEKPGFSYAA